MEDWQKIIRVRCDLCPRAAIWKHSNGGFRCGQCPRW